MKNDELSELASFAFFITFSTSQSPFQFIPADLFIPMYTANYASPISPFTSNMVALRPSSCSVPFRFVHPPSAVYSCNRLNSKHPVVHLTGDCSCIYILSPLVSLPTRLGHFPIVLWLRLFAVDIEARPLHILLFSCVSAPLPATHLPFTPPVQQAKVQTSE